MSSFSFSPYFRTTSPGTSTPCDSLPSSWHLPSTSSCCFIRCWSPGARRIWRLSGLGEGQLTPTRFSGPSQLDRALDYGVLGRILAGHLDLGAPKGVCVGIWVHLGRMPAWVQELQQGTSSGFHAQLCHLPAPCPWVRAFAPPPPQHTLSQLSIFAFA